MCRAPVRIFFFLQYCIKLHKFSTKNHENLIRSSIYLIKMKNFPNKSKCRTSKENIPFMLLQQHGKTKTKTLVCS
jgi:hypothetical protein